jgi:hypothetical protein
MTEFVSDETKFVFRVNTTHPDTDGRRWSRRSLAALLVHLDDGLVDSLKSGTIIFSATGFMIKKNVSRFCDCPICMYICSQSDSFLLQYRIRLMSNLAENI